MDKNSLAKFITDGQNQAIVEKVHTRLQQILTSGEEIIYIAIQHNPIGVLENLSPDCVAATNRRFIVYRPKLLGGADMDDYIWRDLQDIRLKEGMLRATLSFKTVKGKSLSLDNLPKEQARRLYSLSQEIEEKMVEERRQRENEDKRAQSGGIIFQAGALNNPVAPVETTPISITKEDPVQKLKQLKDMLDGELITQAEYDSKKAEILSKM